jgi:integrase
MAYMLGTQAEIIEFPQPKKRTPPPRKTGLNNNKDGSVRKVNGKVYVDFIYLGERVRECAGIPWNEKNARFIRKQLDKIIIEINSGSFKFANVFPKSKKASFFTEKEIALLEGNQMPNQVLFGDYVWEWYQLLKDSDSISERTLGGYRGYIEKYLVPFFGEKTFGELNKSVFDEFVSWAKKQKYRGKSVNNASVKKYFIPLKMVCTDAAIKYGWGGSLDPFFGFKLPRTTEDAYEKIFPFSINEQDRIVAELPEHWKPYFRFAFATGISQGEQSALKYEDIDWCNKTMRIERAITRDEYNRPVEGSTKNKYRKRMLKLSPKMLSALSDQKNIYDRLNPDYFFCSPVGTRFDSSNVRIRVWIPALKRAKVRYRAMRQTRHSFATYHLARGKNPLQIAKFMGHRDAEMILKVYAKFIGDAAGIDD